MSDINRSQSIDELLMLKRTVKAGSAADKALDFAIDSLRIDEAYQMIYEEPDLFADCISRKAVENITWEEPIYTDPLNVLTEVRDKIRELPSVLPKAKKGHWKAHECEGMREKGYYRCSVCNHGYQRYTKGIRKSDIPYIDGQEYILWNCDNYCPHCGADMREVEE